MTKRVFYRFVLLGSATAGIWLMINMLFSSSGEVGPVICPIKNLSGYPCPSCGTTRAFLSLANGDLIGSLHTNPLALLLSPLIVLLPLTAGYDLVRRKELLYQSFQAIEAFMKRPWVAVLFALLVLSNWYWNIIKEL